MTLKIAVHGAAGRMGRSVIEVIMSDPAATLVAAVEQPESQALGQDAGILAGSMTRIDVTVTSGLNEALEAADVVIDFSTPAATAALIKACLKKPVPVVVGTTGLTAATRKDLKKLAKRAPVALAPNFSVGVNALVYLASRAVQLLGPAFDIEIVEMHHRNKVDAPSGTALRLTEAVAKARGLKPGTAMVKGRSGKVGARRAEEIGVMALRGGDVVGEHTLVLAGPGERLELTHRAHNRLIFARGAVRAAHWVVEQKPSCYDMADVLDLPR